MRVIGGEFRSRRLKSLPGLATRPTPDRLRETLFDILGSTIENKVFLDAYAGTGAVGAGDATTGAATATTGAGTGLAGVLTTGLAMTGEADFLTISFTGLAAPFGAGFWFLDTSTAFTAVTFGAVGFTGGAIALTGFFANALSTTLTWTFSIGMSTGLAAGFAAAFFAGAATTAAFAGFDWDLVASGALLTFDFTSVLLAECACACAGFVASPLKVARAIPSVVKPSMLDLVGRASEFSLARECTGFANPKPIN